MVKLKKTQIEFVFVPDPLLWKCARVLEAKGSNGSFAEVFDVVRLSKALASSNLARGCDARAQRPMGHLRGTAYFLHGARLAVRWDPSRKRIFFSSPPSAVRT